MRPSRNGGSFAALKMMNPTALVVLAAAPGCAAAPRTPAQRPAEVWGFTAPWDPRSAASVLAYGGQLDAVVTGWVALDSTSGLPVVVYDDTLRTRLSARTRPMLHVTSWLGDR